MPKSLLLTLFIALLFPLAVEADDKPFPGIKKLMSSEEYSASGLERLSAEELEALNAWLVRYTGGEAAILRVENEEVLEARKDFELRSRISGAFKGWSGETVFLLENGQVWRQRLSGRYFYNGPPNPEVLISRNWMGFFKMTVVETGKSVGVSVVRE